MLGNPVTKTAWKEGYKLLKKEARNRTAGFVYNATNRDSKIPIAMISPGSGSLSNREYLFLNGVREYTNKKKKKILLGHRSFGLKVSFGSNSEYSPRPGGFTPNAFNIDEAYIFGAVQYNGVWKGIRMVKN